MLNFFNNLYIPEVKLADFTRACKWPFKHDYIIILAASQSHHRMQFVIV